jgi:hypothetical protein
MDAAGRRRKPQIAFHVTPARNVAAILREGLIPRRGRRSRDAREFGVGVYLFADRDALEYGIMNWLDAMFSDRTRLAVLRVDISGEAIESGGIEIRLPFWISPNRIEIETTSLK